MTFREGYMVYALFQRRKLMSFIASPCPPSPATLPSRLPSSTKPQATATCGVPLQELSGGINLKGSLKGRVIGGVSQPHLSTWEHQHTIRPVSSFLLWSLKRRSASLLRPQYGNLCCGLPTGSGAIDLVPPCAHFSDFRKRQAPISFSTRRNGIPFLLENWAPPKPAFRLSPI